MSACKWCESDAHLSRSCPKRRADIAAQRRQDLLAGNPPPARTKLSTKAAWPYMIQRAQLEEQLKNCTNGAERRELRFKIKDLTDAIKDMKDMSDEEARVHLESKKRKRVEKLEREEKRKERRERNLKRARRKTPEPKSDDSAGRARTGVHTGGSIGDKVEAEKIEECPSLVNTEKTLQGSSFDCPIVLD